MERKEQPKSLHTIRGLKRIRASQKTEKFEDAAKCEAYREVCFHQLFAAAGRWPVLQSRACHPSNRLLPQSLAPQRIPLKSPAHGVPLKLFLKSVSVFGIQKITLHAAARVP